MSCSQTLSAISKDCNANIGGIKRVLLANSDDVASVTITSEIVTAITMVSRGTPPVAATFLEFAFRPNTGSMTTNAQVSDSGASPYWQTDVVMAFNRLETAKSVAIKALAQADLIGIVEDMNGKYWLVGFENPLNISAGAAASGTQRGDRNGYDITLTDVSSELPHEVDSTIISGLL